ncbi:MAG: ATP-binding protein [Desulfobacula sp.]|nr:ATP-binding protein [Desulfobacula sp.]
MKSKKKEYISDMKSKIKRIIADFHQGLMPEIRYRSLEVPLQMEKIITIVGPRRAGKTFYLFQLMYKLEKMGVPRQDILYINFEDERLDLDGDNDLIFDAYRELYPERNLFSVYLFFDEIQELPNWEKFVRRVMDTVSRHIFLTGSNSRLLSREIATSLRGRGISFEILPLSFAEYLSFQDLPTHQPVSGKDRALVGRAFEQYCLWGGYPELIEVDERFKAHVLQEYFNVMFYRDLVERYKISEPAVLKYLLKRLVSSFTKEFSINKIYNDLKSRGFSIGKDSLYRMMDEVFDIYMLARIERHDPAVVRREMSNKKVYLYDNGLATALHYSFAEDRGKLLENVVFRRLREMTHEIYFLRNGWECDFVVFPQGQPRLLIQVTDRLDQSNLGREVKGLTAGKERLGIDQALLLVDSAQADLDIPEWIRVVPVVEWLLE